MTLKFLHIAEAVTFRACTSLHLCKTGPAVQSEMSTLHTLHGCSEFQSLKLFFLAIQTC